MTLLIFFASLALLIAGAEILVRGASGLAAFFGISPLVIGLTVVAFGTSSPEMAVSVKSALAGHSDLILGTNVGSTTFNILFILGVSALISPLPVSQQLIWYEVPIMIGAHLLLLLFCLNGAISKPEAFILFSCIVIYTVFAIYQSRKTSGAVKEEYKEAFPKKSYGSLFKQIVFVVIGLILCVLGANYLVESSLVLARAMGVSELVIAATIVAAGTSLPEVATSIVAAFRGQSDISIGNVVGSSIFNTLGIIGLSGLFTSNGIEVAPSFLYFNLPVAIAACIACLPIFFSGHRITRLEGILFLGSYAAYTFYIINYGPHFR